MHETQGLDMTGHLTLIDNACQSTGDGCVAMQSMDKLLSIHDLTSAKTGTISPHKSAPDPSLKHARKDVLSWATCRQH